MQPGLAAAPFEVLVQIGDLALPRDLAAMTAVNRHFRQAFASPTLPARQRLLQAKLQVAAPHRVRVPELHLADLRVLAKVTHLDLSETGLCGPLLQRSLAMLGAYAPRLRTLNLSNNHIDGR
ncbi:MAG: hypothetical protein EOO40_08850, partial [Deltaproteobacteria bacterium]